MVQLLHILAMVIVIVVLNNRTIVKSVSSESPHFCGYSTYRSTCPGDYDYVEIRYPFWIKNLTVDNFGDCISYPGFQIKCAANGRPVINISNNMYYVLYIDIFEGGGNLALVVMDAHKCPQPQRNISIESMRFFSYYDIGTASMTFFYNCSRYPQNVVQHIPCLDNHYSNSTGGRSFAFFNHEISGQQFDWYQNCEEAVVVPATYGLYRTDINYTEALNSYFTINFQYPVNCGNCERSGGKCWVNETNQGITTPFHCNCTDGTSRVDDICPDKYVGLGHDAPPGAGAAAA